ncbi:MAG: hypothetical protein ABFS09_07630 [Thermodesulfobacteriota bacterium]
MALVNIATAPKQVAILIKKAAPQQGVEVLTYKRNRGVEIIKTADDELAVREWGYHEEKWQVGKEKLGKLLKAILKREFPRSRKVRIYQLNSLEDMGKALQKI